MPLSGRSLPCNNSTSEGRLLYAARKGVVMIVKKEDKKILAVSILSTNAFYNFEEKGVGIWSLVTLLISTGHLQWIQCFTPKCVVPDLQVWEIKASTTSYSKHLFWLSFESCFSWQAHDPARGWGNMQLKQMENTISALCFQELISHSSLSFFSF